MNKLSHVVKHLFWVIIIYIFVYAPPFRALDVNISTILSLPLFIAFASKLRTAVNLVGSSFAIETTWLFLILSFVMGVSVTGDAGFALPFFILIVFNFFTAILIVAANHHLRTENFFSILVDASFLAGVISIFLFFDIEFNQWVKFSLLKYDEFMMRFQLFRGFGFSDELLFSYSIVQSVAFYLVIDSKFHWLKKIIYLAVIFFSIVVNAKIGILFSILALLIYMFRGGVSIPSVVFYLLIITGGALLLSTLLEEDNAFTLQIALFFNELFEFDDAGLGESSLEDLTGNMLFLPSDAFSLIFGSGVNLFASTIGPSSDSGWILLIHYGGIFLSLAVLILFGFMCVRLVSRDHAHLAIFLFAVLFLSNFKGLIFYPKPGMRYILLIYIFLIVEGCRFWRFGKHEKL